MPLTHNAAIIDLFAGCGGLSLGFELAGFTVAAAVESDPVAAKTYAANHPHTNLIMQDIRTVSDFRSIILEQPLITAVVGGPPCQGFSLSGKRRSDDPRNSLYEDLLRCVWDLRPKIVLIENVPGLLSMKKPNGELVVNDIRSGLSAAGYESACRVLDAADFGVPQHRRRVFIVGVRRDIVIDPEQLFPVGQERRISVDEAISDLPLIEAGEDGSGQEYRTPPTNDFQVWARQGTTGIHNHAAMRHTLRLIERFRLLKPGQGAADVPPEHAQRKRGSPETVSEKRTAQNNRRLFGDRPAPTVPAGWQSNFIHPHLHRNLTVREAARLQSFPDRYIFYGKRTTMSWESGQSQCQQVGNAVPPLLAYAFATRIAQVLHLDLTDRFPKQQGGNHAKAFKAP